MGALIHQWITMTLLGGDGKEEKPGGSRSQGHAFERSSFPWSLPVPWLLGWKLLFSSHALPPDALLSHYSLAGMVDRNLWTHEQEEAISPACRLASYLSQQWESEWHTTHRDGFLKCVKLRFEPRLKLAEIDSFLEQSRKKINNEALLGGMY